MHLQVEYSTGNLKLQHTENKSVIGEEIQEIPHGAREQTLHAWRNVEYPRIKWRAIENDRYLACNATTAIANNHLLDMVATVIKVARSRIYFAVTGKRRKCKRCPIVDASV